MVQRAGGEKDETPHFESPFRGENENPTTKIPSFADYMSKKPETSNKVFQYFMVGSMGLLTAAGAKATVQGAFFFSFFFFLFFFRKGTIVARSVIQSSACIGADGKPRR